MTEQYSVGFFNEILACGGVGVTDSAEMMETVATCKPSSCWNHVTLTACLCSYETRHRPHLQPEDGVRLVEQCFKRGKNAECPAFAVEPATPRLHLDQYYVSDATVRRLTMLMHVIQSRINTMGRLARTCGSSAAWSSNTFGNGQSI